MKEIMIIMVMVITVILAGVLYGTQSFPWTFYMIIKCVALELLTCQLHNSIRMLGENPKKSHNTVETVEKVIVFEEFPSWYSQPMLY